jgi:adenylate cyclase
MAGTFRDTFAGWLVETGAAATSIPVLIDTFCRFLTAHGYAIHRCNLATDTIHPQMTGFRHVWFAEAADAGPITASVTVQRRQFRIGDALIDEIFFREGSKDTPQYRASPFYHINQHGELYAPVRPIGEEQPFPLFDDLAQQGCTAYFGLKLNSFAGMSQNIGMASRRPGGLEPWQVDDLRWSLGLLTLHLNTLVEASIKDTLARVYLGRDPGQRVSQGMIASGNVVALEGALWFSDLRGFTEASGRMSAEELVETLNTYFAALVGEIYARDGEILKFIGDAILAVFPTARFGDAQGACRAAFEVVGAVERNLEAVNAERAAAGKDPLAHGIGLHYGEARYGNVGTQERLDFTLIGREVNIASRIEGLTKDLARSPLCSGTFADAASLAMDPLGGFELKGVAGKVEILSPGRRD